MQYVALHVVFVLIRLCSGAKCCCLRGLDEDCHVQGYKGRYGTLDEQVETQSRRELVSTRCDMELEGLGNNGGHQGMGGMTWLWNVLHDPN